MFFDVILCGFPAMKAKLGCQYGQDMIEYDDRSNKRSCCTSVTALEGMACHHHCNTK